MYKVIEFENEEVAVVFETWLTPNKENTFWPSDYDQLSYVRTLRKKEVDHSWQTYPIARIFYETDDVDKALQKVSAAENTSNLETDIEESAVSVIKRKRIKKRVFCESDSDEEKSTSVSKTENIKRPPPVKFGNKSLSQLNLNTARGPKIFKQNTSTKSDCSSEDHLIAHNVRPPPTKFVSRSSLYLGSNSSITGPPRTSSTLSAGNCGCHEVVTQLLTKIVKIEQQNGQILTALRQQSTGKNISAPKLNTNFPAKSVDDLHLLEEELTEENTAYLESYLSSLGGEGVVARTNRILKELLCDRLAIQFNFCGGNDKQAFNKLKLKTVVVDSVKNALKETTTENVENAIKIWLKHASHRVKRRDAAQAKEIRPNVFMASLRDSPDDDGYKRFTEELNINNVSYGSSSNTNPVDEMGSRSSLSRDVELANDADHWEMNYHEAAIFLEEGENNEKFDSHPRHPSALPAYLLVHNSWYYGLDLAFSIMLLLLALVENPSVDAFDIPIWMHGTLELVALAVIGIELALKLRWIGWSTILRHKRTMVKCLTLTIMVAEAITVLIRQSSHFRVTRALRPIFLVDTRACGAVRRYIRQILQSLPPILDMLVLLLFFVCSYALLGYFLFGNHEKNLYFKTLGDSFVSMFVLLTTANFPDVMMPSYAISKWSAVFFVSYISTVLYVLMNLMLAVVYETFTGIEKDKFRKLLLHKRQACKLAFRLLVSKQNPNVMRFKQFQGIMRYYSPKTSLRDVVLIFHQLNTSNTGLLTQEEFLNIYDAVTLRWMIKNPPDPWFSAAWPPLRVLCRASRTVVSWEYFEHIIYVVIIANGLAMFIRVMESSVSLEEGAKNFCASWDAWLFYLLFFIEALLKIIGLGWNEYISSGWNFFDFTVTLVAAWGSLMLLLTPGLTVVVILRPLRILRIFKLKKRYRDIFGTLVLLSPLMWSTAVVMMVMYYFFAIIGMELFSSYDLRNCCVNSTVEDFYKFSSNSSTSGIGYYYLNNFDNLFVSGVTLFELTVVNNWFIIMDAYASVSASYSRLFFMAFYLFTMVVLTIVVASVLEAFRFRIQYKKQTSKRDEEQMLHEEVIVDWSSLQRQVQDPKLLEALQADFMYGGASAYVGRRRRTRDVLQHRMYSTEISQWLLEAELEERNDINNIIEEAQINARLINA